MKKAAVLCIIAVASLWMLGAARAGDAVACKAQSDLHQLGREYTANGLLAAYAMYQSKNALGLCWPVHSASELYRLEHVQSQGRTYWAYRYQ